jgi:hypothetical protein
VTPAEVARVLRRAVDQQSFGTTRMRTIAAFRLRLAMGRIFVFLVVVYLVNALFNLAQLLVTGG